MGLILAEDGTGLLDEAGGSLLDEAGLPPFPASPLDLRCELDLGGTWTNITGYNMQRDGTQPPVRITRGRANEQANATPTSVSAQWNNRDGRFSPRNPAGPFYGLLGRNTPLRYSVPAPGSYLRFADDAISSASCPSTASLQLAADIDIRVDLQLDNFAPCFLAGQWGPAACWALTLNGDGTLRFAWNDNSSINHVSSVMPVPLGRVAVRAWFDPAGTSGSPQVIFYTAPSMGGTFTQLGTAVAITAGDYAHSTGSNPLVCGYSPGWHDGAIGPSVITTYQAGLQGAVYELRLYSGATLVADPVLSAQPAATASFADAQGNTWTLSGSAAVSARTFRAHAECTTLPQRWDVTGADVWTPVSAKGVMRRIQQNSAPLPSAMRRAMAGVATAWNVLAYWPCEDAQGSTRIASGLPGGQPAAVSGAPGFQAAAGSKTADSAFACSAQLAQVQSSTWTAAVPVTAASVSAGFSETYLLLSVPSGGIAGSPVVLQLATSDGNVLTAAYSSASGGTLSFAWNGTASGGPTGINGVPLMMIISLADISGTISGSVTTLQPGQAASAALGNSLALTASTMAVRAITVNPAGANLGATEIGHLAVACGSSAAGAFGPATGLPSGLALVLAAWAGETAANRILRLCAENGIAGRVYGYPDLTTAMGAQPVDTFSNLLKYCEDADRGQLYEPAEALGVGYRTRGSLYNQGAGLILDYSQAQIGDGSTPLEPTDDDQFTVNDVTLQRNNGSSVQVQVTSGPMSVSAPPAGVGDYSTQVTLYNQNDSDLANIAGWMAWTGTCNEERYPSVPLSLARPQLAALVNAIQALRIGDYAQILNMPAQLPPGPVNQLLWGYTESLGGFHWDFTANTVPEAPYQVLQAGAGHIDTDGTTLGSGVSSGATSLSFVTAAGFPVWTTSAADFPLDVMIAGERVTVTNITGSSSPQTAAVTRSVNGVVKAQAAGAAVSVYPAVAIGL